MIVPKTITLAQRARALFVPRSTNLTQADVADARQFISDHWRELERYHPNDDKTLVGLPFPYIVPSNDPTYGFNELYYWDSFFMVQSMLSSEHVSFLKGIVEDLLTLMQRFHIIPNGSRTYFTGRSQPPLLTSLIMEVYRLDGDVNWLEKAMAIAKEEYNTVWMGTEQPNWRLVHRGLSRYYDINTLHDLAEAESGWDMTTRFSRKALDYLPVDLNALLYKYETDFAEAAKIVGNEKQSAEWLAKAKNRKNVMDELMWSKAFGIYYDYNFKRRKRGTVVSLASYYPLWAGMVSEHQAEQLVKSLKKFEHKGGLATTDGRMMGQRVFGNMPVQWAYPNGWAPLHFLVVEGLKRYGYEKEAREIAIKWLKTNLAWFKKHGEFLEKYNVVNPSNPPLPGVYPTQTGFGWTNAIFERFCQEFVDK